MHTEQATPIHRITLLWITLAAYAVALMVSLSAWYAVVRLVLHVGSYTFLGTGTAIIALGLAIAALAFYWEHTD